MVLSYSPLRWRGVVRVVLRMDFDVAFTDVLPISWPVDRV